MAENSSHTASAVVMIYMQSPFPFFWYASTDDAPSSLSDEQSLILVWSHVVVVLEGAFAVVNLGFFGVERMLRSVLLHSCCRTRLAPALELVSGGPGRPEIGRWLLDFALATEFHVSNIQSPGIKKGPWTRPLSGAGLWAYASSSSSSETLLADEEPKLFIFAEALCGVSLAERT